MIDQAVVDTGPLVAIVRQRETSHKKCVDAIKRLRPPLLTCWPVLTEAAWLLRKEPGGIKAIGYLIRSGAVRLIELDDQALHWCLTFMERYASAEAQLADAALMYLAEQEKIGTVFTLDVRDFSVYRTSDGRALTILPEP